jgi:hypothetical protein
MKRKAGMPIGIPVSFGRSNFDEAHFANSLMWHFVPDGVYRRVTTVPMVI